MMTLLTYAFIFQNVIWKFKASPKCVFCANNDMNPEENLPANVVEAAQEIILTLLPQKLLYVY